MKSSPTISSKLTTNHDLRRLRAEIVSALRCSELLDQMVVRFAFRPGSGAVGAEVDLDGAERR